MTAPATAAVLAPAVPAPRSGIVKSMVAGDVMCYVTLDVGRARAELGATFELCERSAALVGKRVRLTYRLVPVNDCRGADPCGRSRRVEMITAMHVIPMAR